ncbi:peroxidase 12-like [Chenopodium quinoa]|uniref:peroxidase 12-like n=1 Tax=Chenopodium quinoa TaxID=63459 RepID=UPI000B79A619|nr:peroxidase 12-like [Chenopodium quinoa]
MGSSKFISLSLVLFSLVVGICKGQSTIPVVPGLSYSFYSSSCPDLEFIVRSHLWEVFNNDITQAAGLLRLHFHDCFVQGCDGSVLLVGSASGPDEQDAPPNLTLRAEAFKIIEDLRALVHNACGPIVSCSDIVALAARESVFLPAGPYYEIPLGRRDSLNFATTPETLANLPPPTFNTTSLLNAFTDKNLTTTDLVALSGGHTIGRGHCTSFANRLYPTQDPTMDQTFANNLKLTCPTNTTVNTTNLDIRTPNLFDNKYFVDLMNRQGLFTSDLDLYTDSRTRSIVKNFAVNQTLFFEKFVEGMIKMGQLEVLTGSQGEIRTNCSVRNGDNIGLASVVKEQQEQGMLSQY